MSQYSSKWLKVSEPFPHVLHVELARAPVNAFSVEFWKAYGKLFDSLTEDGYDVRALVLSSAFPKIFTAGIDLSDLSGQGAIVSANSPDNARAALQTRKQLLAFQSAIGAPERTPFPVIAALHGHVIGLGVDIIGPCDIRFAASNTSFIIKEVDVGLAPDIGTLAFLPKITGNHSLVRELTYTSRPFSAAEAEKFGLVSKVVVGGREEVIKESLELAKVIAAKSPVAVASAKHLITHSRDHTVAENLASTAAWNGAALQTNDIAANLQAALKKQKASFPPLAVPTKTKL
ncbi:unnamed protein product [Cyclocybe aegerita]|uniref:Delta(3,5)-Delta(2,4)-dienoyl-CoA isomerase n=1 Tax=Cyclocybe aegerita TaxID=1973307 RepID=A0A8S0WB19_CYCAE|nr:unnamed protein product [Cyclocybe aegerita]